MEYDDEIQKLEGEILELKDELRKVTDRELIYKEILTEVSESISSMLNRDDENERFRFDEKINFKLFVENIKDDSTKVHVDMNRKPDQELKDMIQTTLLKKGLKDMTGSGENVEAYGEDNPVFSKLYEKYNRKNLKDYELAVSSLYSTFVFEKEK